MATSRFLAAFLATALVGANAHAGFIELITNGDFETGTFAGWTTFDQALSFVPGAWFIDVPGTTTPASVSPTAANASGGSFYAVSDQGGGGTHALIQSFVVPLGVTSLTLAFDMFVNDQSGAGPIVNLAGLDFTAVPNQHARVDILTAAAPPLSTAVADVVSNHYLGIDPLPNPNPYTAYSIPLVGLTPGTTYQLRFAEVDNQLFFNQGVDNVSILAEVDQVVPEPTSLALFGMGVLGAGIGARRRRRKRQPVASTQVT